MDDEAFNKAQRIYDNMEPLCDEDEAEVDPEEELDFDKYTPQEDYFEDYCDE